MRRTLQIYICAVVLAFVGGSVYAQETIPDKTKTAREQSDSSRGMYGNDGKWDKTMKKGNGHAGDSMRHAPDNTGRNKRDRDSTALTPMDQSNDPGDLEITRKIRSEIIDQDDMSVNARNIKIITVNGHVTLRGPVNSEEEKNRIAGIAEKIAQSGNVDNKLEVKKHTDKK